MEVIVFSRNYEHRNRIKHIVDDIIVNKRLRLMSLHTSNPVNTNELLQALRDGKGYLVIMEITEFELWEQTITDISEKFRTVNFCLISDSGEAAPETINLMLNVCGYIDTSSQDICKTFEQILLRVYARISTVCGGLLTFNENGELKVIKYRDIYYIETIKQQHRCTVYHKKGSDIIRADISKLINRLDGRFEITRSSTIANLSAATKLSDRMIYFEDGNCCSVTEKKLGEVKKSMQSLALI